MKYFLIFAMCFSAAYAQTSPYTGQTAFGYQDKRHKTDSTFSFVTGCGAYSLRNGVSNMAALFYDSCGHRFGLFRPEYQAWLTIGSGGGGAGGGISQVLAGYGLAVVDDSTLKVDTTLIATRGRLKQVTDSLAAVLRQVVNDTAAAIRAIIPDTSGKWITQVVRRSDSVFTTKGGVQYFAFRDSTGGGSSGKVYGVNGVVNVDDSTVRADTALLATQYRLDTTRTGGIARGLLKLSIGDTLRIAGYTSKARGDSLANAIADSIVRHNIIFAGQSNADNFGDSLSSLSVPDSIGALTFRDGSLQSLKKEGSMRPAFAISYTNKTQQKVTFIETAVGSSSVYCGTSPSNNWDSCGNNFKNAITAYKAAIAAQRVLKIKPVLIGVAWSQGEADGAGATDTAIYHAKLSQIFQRFRDTLGMPYLPIFIFRTGVNASAAAPYEIYNDVIAVQEKIVAEDPYTFMVYRDTKDYIRMGLQQPTGPHYTQAGYERMGMDGAANIVNALTGHEVFATQNKKVSIGGINPITAALMLPPNDSTFYASLSIGKSTVSKALLDGETSYQNNWLYGRYGDSSKRYAFETNPFTLTSYGNYFTNAVSSLPTVDTKAGIYSTFNSGGLAFPFSQNGNLIIQPRLVGGSFHTVFISGSTPSVKMTVWGATGNVSIGADATDPLVKLKVAGAASVTGVLNVLDSINAATSVNVTNLHLVGAPRASYPSTTADAFIYRANSGGTYPHTIAGNLVILPRTSAAADIILGGGTTITPILIAKGSDLSVLIGSTSGTTTGEKLQVTGTSKFTGAMTITTATTSDSSNLAASTAWVKRQGFGVGTGGGGSTLSNIGTGYRIGINFTTNLKSIGAGYNLLGDSTGTANTIVFTPDTTSNNLHLATQGFVSRAIAALPVGSSYYNTNIGTGYNLTVPFTNNVRRLAFVAPLSADSTTTANTVTVKFDTSTYGHSEGYYNTKYQSQIGSQAAYTFYGNNTGSSATPTFTNLFTSTSSGGATDSILTVSPSGLISKIDRFNGQPFVRGNLAAIPTSVNYVQLRNLNDTVFFGSNNVAYAKNNFSSNANFYSPVSFGNAAPSAGYVARFYGKIIMDYTGGADDKVTLNAYGNVTGTASSRMLLINHTVSSGAYSGYLKNIEATATILSTTPLKGIRNLHLSRISGLVDSVWQFTIDSTSAISSPYVYPITIKGNNGVNRIETITNQFPNLPAYTTGGNKTVVLNTTSGRLETMSTTGSAALAGTATFAAGTVTVNTTAVQTGSVIMFSYQNCSNCGTAYKGTVTSSTSFVINSTNVLDASSIAWQIIY